MTNWGEKWPGGVSDRGSPTISSATPESGEGDVFLQSSPHPSPDTKSLSPGQKQAQLLSIALDYKLELITTIRTYPINLENASLHALGARLADSTVNQVLQIEANALQRKTESDEIEKIFEERQRYALREIERLGRHDKAE